MLVSPSYFNRSRLMTDPKKPAVEEMIEKVLSALPTDMRQIKTDFEEHLRQALHSAFSRMDLVTREEFDVQAALLARTRERLEQMIERLEELEATKTERQSTDKQ